MSVSGYAGLLCIWLDGYGRENGMDWNGKDGEGEGKERAREGIAAALYVCGEDFCF